MPPLESDDEQEDEEGSSKARGKGTDHVLKERHPDASSTDRQGKPLDQSLSTQLQVSNKAFTCYIKQYGVKVKEDDPDLANAGEGKRWERKFGLFGTQIV